MGIGNASSDDALLIPLLPAIVTSWYLSTIPIIILAYLKLKRK